MYPPLAETRSRDGTRIAFASIGDGYPLVMLPGVPLSNLRAEWRIPVLRTALETVATQLRLVQYDGRGTGRSQRDVTDFSLDSMLGDLDAVIAAAGLQRFALLGFYSSCSHAIAYAARHPERVSHLILFGGVAQGWDHMRGPGTQALLSLIERDWDTFVESVTHAWLGWPDDEEGRLAVEWFRTATTPEVARATIQAASGIDVSDLLADVRCPALVLHRRDATVIPIEVSESMANRLPAGRLEILDGTSASLFFERPDEVVRLIIDFVLDSAAPGTTRRRSRGSSALTRREIEVLRLVAAGESNAEIAATLGLSVNTVERHVSNIYRKVDARGRADATAYAIRHGIA